MIDVTGWLLGGFERSAGDDRSDRSNRSEVSHQLGGRRHWVSLCGGGGPLLRAGLGTLSLTVVLWGFVRCDQSCLCVALWLLYSTWRCRESGTGR